MTKNKDTTLVPIDHIAQSILIRAAIACCSTASLQRPTA